MLVNYNIYIYSGTSITQISLRQYKKFSSYKKYIGFLLCNTKILFYNLIFSTSNYIILISIHILTVSTYTSLKLSLFVLSLYKYVLNDWLMKLVAKH